MTDKRFQLKDANIVAEVFGNEVVIVNLDSGIYYSLRDTAAQIWLRVQNAYSLGEMLQDFSLVYDAAVTEMGKALEPFIGQLISYGLITEAQQTKYQRIDAGDAVNKIPFEAPVIEVFSDMQDILLLDPVHDVDKAGWPVTKEQSNS